MYKNKFTDLETSVTPKELKEILAPFDFIIPAELQKHILTLNGGEPERCLCIVNDRIFVVQNFLPVKYSSSSAVRFEDVLSQLKGRQPIIPSHLIPFAIDPGGDFFCISNSEKDFGEIFFYRGEYSDDPRRAVSFLAPSLEQFVENLAPDD